MTLRLALSLCVSLWALACATGDVPGLLERLYPLGQAPPRDSIEIRFVRAFPVSKLAPRYPDRAIEVTGTVDTSFASEVFTYDAALPTDDPGVGIHVNRWCDYVLVDSERRVIGAFRVREMC